jgi:hypothetical protein
LAERSDRRAAASAPVDRIGDRGGYAHDADLAERFDAERIDDVVRLVDHRIATSESRDADHGQEFPYTEH